MLKFLIQNNNGELLTIKDEEITPLNKNIDNLSVDDISIIKDEGFSDIDKAIKHFNNSKERYSKILTNEKCKNLKLNVIPHPQIVLAKDDINIKHIEKVIEAELIASKNVKMIASNDKGKSWKTFYEDKWVDVNIGNIEELKEKGISKNKTEKIGYKDWNNLIKDNNFLRFGYLLYPDEELVQPEVSKLIFKCNLKGKWEKAEHIEEYDYYYQYNDILNVVFMADGSYKINYHE